MNGSGGTLAFEGFQVLVTQAQNVAMTLPRLYAVFMVVPFLSGRMLTGAVRHALVFMLAAFMSPAIGELPPLDIGVVLTLVAKEALIGFMLGVGFSVFLWAIESVGDLIDFQTGSGNAAYFDPVAGHERGPTAQFLSWTVVTVFISAGGLLAMMGTVLDSYRLWPVGQWLPHLSDVLERFVVHEGDKLFTWIVKLAAPVLVVLLLVELGIGLINRFVPQLDVFTFTQPIKNLLAVFMQLLFLFFIYESLQEFMRPGNGALDYLNGLLLRPPPPLAR